MGRGARAGTDAQLKAEIPSYSRTHGLFAGINLSDGGVRADAEDNADLYGKAVLPKDVVMRDWVKPPDVVKPFMAALEREP